MFVIMLQKLKIYDKRKVKFSDSRFYEYWFFYRVNYVIIEDFINELIIYEKG